MVVASRKDLKFSMVISMIIGFQSRFLFGVIISVRRRRSTARGGPASLLRGDAQGPGGLIKGNCNVDGGVVDPTHHPPGFGRMLNGARNVPYVETQSVQKTIWTPLNATKSSTPGA